MHSGNRGEWSELYALFRLLGDKQVHAGDENIEQIPEILYPILKVFRSEATGEFEYTIDQDIVIISTEGKELLRLPVMEFAKQADSLLSSIQHVKGSIVIPETEQFMKRIYCSSIKASSSAKTDITIMIHDRRIQQKPTLGFSIKSQLGNPSTLLNAGKTTNFIYQIDNLDLTKSEINEINAISTKCKIRDRIKTIMDLGGDFRFYDTEKIIFKNNLTLIDSYLPQILSEMVLEFYGTGISRTKDIAKAIEVINPLDYDVTNFHQYYTYKIKRFLTDVALGMMPSKVWAGEYDATGGYLIVKESGEILCYHIYNRNDFENYLLNNTKLETASTTRHDFGKIYINNNELFFKLNLQIRFIK